MKVIEALFALGFGFLESANVFLESANKLLERLVSELKDLTLLQKDELSIVIPGSAHSLHVIIFLEFNHCWLGIF